MSSSSKSIQCPVMVLSVTGSNVLGFNNAVEVRDHFLSVAVQSGALHIVIDLKDIEYLQSAGFRPLLSLRRLIHEQRQGRVVLCNLRPAVRDVLAISRMISAEDDYPSPFEMETDVPSAISLLFQPPKVAEEAS